MQINNDVVSGQNELIVGILNPGNLDFCVESAAEKAEADVTPDLLAKIAAYLMWCISANHVFKSGNKRTAYQAASVFLEVNGAEMVEVGESEAVEMLVKVELALVTREELARWVKKHLRPIPSA